MSVLKRFDCISIPHIAGTLGTMNVGIMYQFKSQNCHENKCSTINNRLIIALSLSRACNYEKDMQHHRKVYWSRTFIWMLALYKKGHIKEALLFNVTVWLNWSLVKTSILIGSLSCPNFALQTAKMDCSRTDFTDLCSWNGIQKETFWC